MQVNVLIVGRGLAGSTLAWRLAERGVPLAVVDRGGVDADGRPSASRVAAGLITPVTGQRLTVAADFDMLWASAKAFYRRVGKAARSDLLHEAPAVRLFVDADERRRFEARTAAGELGDHARLATTDDLPAGLAAPHGGFVMPSAARLDIDRYLGATAYALSEEERLIPGEVDADNDLRVDADGVSIERLDLRARRVVFCQGYTPKPPRWLAEMILAPAKGELLDVRPRGAEIDRVLHRGVWIAPGDSGRVTVGATTEWDRLDATPSDEGRRELLGRLADAGLNDVEVLDHRAAVRPATPNRQPTYGLCRDEPRVGWFNGLGAKGALWAPWHAERFAEDLAS